MATKKKWITPPGIAQFPRLATPNTRFNPDGDWELQMKFEGEAANEVRKVLDEMLEIAFKEAQKQLAKKPAKLKTLNRLLPYDEDEDGNVILKLRKKALVRKKDGSTYTTKIIVVDPLVKPIDPREVTSGSLVRCELKLETYYMPSNNSAMVLKRWYGVQLLKKNEQTMVGFDAMPEYATEFDDGVEEDPNFDVEEGFEDGDF